MLPQPRGYVGKTHHVNAQRHTDQKICRNGQLVKTELERAVILTLREANTH